MLPFLLVISSVDEIAESEDGRDSISDSAAVDTAADVGFVPDSRCPASVLAYKDGIIADPP